MQAAPQRPRTAVVLVNLGTPEAPTTSAVRRYLAQFLRDPRVIELPRWLWLPILYGVILVVRPPRSARAYREVWTERGSPLRWHTEDLAAALARRTDADVRVAMRYGEPSIARIVRELAARGTQRVLVLPLYPQYSATTTASVFDAFADAYARERAVPALRFVAQYHDEPGYLDALTASIRAHRDAHGAAQRLLFSFHGIPLRYVRAGDPYGAHCEATAKAVATRLGLREDEWSMSYQSRVGREEWLGPDTEHVLAQWPAQGVRSVQVVCPGFAVDCLETLEEIAIRARETFVHAGGERFEYVPALNASDAHADALAQLVARELSGWSARA